MRSCAHPEREKRCGDSGAPRGTCGSADGCGVLIAAPGRLRAAHGAGHRAGRGHGAAAAPQRGANLERHRLSPERLRGEARVPRAAVSP